MQYCSDLDTRLLKLSESDFFTVRDACQGVAVTGAVGSGKTSGSGAALAGAYLRAGMGGLVLCAKPEEATLWKQYLARHGRADSLIEFSPGQNGFNFLSYELARQGSGGINSVIECLMRVLEAARAASPSPGRSGDAFWEETTRQILRNTVPILHAAYGTVSIQHIVDFVRSAPQSKSDLKDANWRESSFFAQTVEAEQGRLQGRGAQIVAYWRDEFANFDPKLRSNISITLTTMLDRFNHGWLQQALCGATTIVPELCFHGAIILLNMPALTLNEDGIIAQQVVKYMWQRAVLARNGLHASQQDRPVFLWADEAQYFVNSYDAEFLSTCRGSRACTVYLSQSLPTYYAKVAGDNARDRVHHLLGNFATKIFHSNGCAETNEWAARSLGRMAQQRYSYSTSQGGGSNWGYNDSMNMNDGSSTQYASASIWGNDSRPGMPQGYNSSVGRGESRGASEGGSTSYSSGHSYSEHMDYVIEPGEFARILRTGGPANKNIVTGVWFQAGRRFDHSSGNALLASFQQ